MSRFRTPGPPARRLQLAGVVPGDGVHIAPSPFCQVEAKWICSGHMRATLLLLVVLAAPALANQVVWKWVDKDGVTHYSDRPVAGATRVELNVGGSRGEPSATASGSSSTTSQSRPDAGPPYRNFEIWKPGNDETIPNTGGQVAVNIRVDPALQPGHTLHLYLDGRLVQGFADNTLEYELQEVPRGTHSLVAVINSRGTRVQETAPVTFHVRQQSVAQPPVGPALRPPPKPQPRGANKLPSTQPSYAAVNGQRALIDPATNAPRVPKPAPVGPKPGN